MRKIKSYEEFLNEENLFRNVAIGGALVGSLMGSPKAVGQDFTKVDSEDITGKYGVDEIESAKGDLVQNVSDFEELINKVKETTETLGGTIEKKWYIVKVEDLSQWNQFRVTLKEKNVQPGNIETHEIYIPKEDFQSFLESGKPTEWIVNTFINLEDNPIYVYKNKRKSEKSYNLDDKSRGI